MTKSQTHLIARNRVALGASRVGKILANEIRTARANERSELSVSRCIVVDDDPALRDLLCMIMVDLGFAPAGFGYSADLLDQITQLRPALITLDLSIYDSNCWDLLDVLQRNPETSTIPLLCVSTLDELLVRAEYEYAFTGGAAFLKKPFDIRDVEKAVVELTAD